MTTTSGAATDGAHEGRIEGESLEFARGLIRIDSVNTGVTETTGNGEARAARFVAERLAEVGYEPEWFKPVPGRASIVARLRGTDPAAGALVVHAHLDVVPVDGQAWTHPPFGAETHDGILYGRGAVDMKGFAGTMLAVARALAREGRAPRRDLVFAFFADEEAGGRYGSRWIVAERPEVFAGATEALGEVGGFSLPLREGRRAYLVATGEKGSVSIDLVARGRAGHGSRPTPDNAVVALARAVTAVADHPFPIVRTPALDRFIGVLAREFGAGPVGDEALDGFLERLGPPGRLISAAARTTVSPTVLEGGVKRNVIPAEARAQLDIRTVPGHERTIAAELRAIVGNGIEVVERGSIPAIESPMEGELIELLQAAITGEDADGIIVPFQMPANTDNKALALLGIRGHGFTPLRLPNDFDAFGQFHAADEHVPVESLRFGGRVLWRVLRGS
ncbi:M20/M25/M40 family metallo-hydrolase [Pseudoclavibacter chungangensis]|uniref:M20/M25/M40 family metallo-hydrolase n=1 Tax=Pseudoclavibacter chungangensis TaxID=587635 RepID=A0A7J5BZN4_9MICO|nr:M20/M25/M40 family metallo-hydrolase [Pseudoclavibacter chungangensis]KAB1659697.1 M20/M25/M40 family metallo-hydrolase [Pseudoclavibacter chungangensis]NYJ67537.1 acetylornithine deacetylase/succinyl-diaminopimelate desuccinylase-like protein [Pseudoclavibacter chungangensis]